ncbi:flavodoxin [Campylobacter upsaliensis]|uniref:flavodoxin n=1 Tax=Campylobacter upsaliensis TaxID=28080 RepID=UPI002B3F91B9|nr:flavodoxin [Campylobacter upsaliensis]MEB2804567.1 flavodoxin [Campylobacter upsaliensis]MEB2812694.1 flavodoxin [Campylobacter upsaliensis]MEB2817867.1 flavodoxin [Campylobacter upsaliensis]MEB2823778.1 flavodoxin [Campylobacter upsaliensis]
MNTLVAFFSASGITKEVAQTLSIVANAKLYEILPKEPYSKADLDWTNDTSRTSLEAKDKASRPQILDTERLNIADFDVIFIGFPIWWYSAPHIIYSFLESYDFNHKIIIPFCTSGGSELGNAPKDMQKCAPNAIFKNGKKFSFGANKSSMRKWLNELELT